MLNILNAVKHLIWIITNTIKSVHEFYEFHIKIAMDILSSFIFLHDHVSDL